MKKLIFPLLLLSVVLAGCGQQGLSQDELFTKKQECAKYESEVIDRIQKDNLTYISNRFTHSQNLDQLFYSPIKNSCLFSIFVIEEQDGKTTILYKIYDVFTKQWLELLTSEEATKKIKELKGE